MKKIIITTMLFCLLSITNNYAQTSWPQKINSKEGYRITIYQPQSENLSDNIYNGRAAFSVINGSSADPVFGVCWFKATLNNAKSKLGDLRDISIYQLKLPDSTHKFNIDVIKKAIQTELPEKNIQFEMAELSKSAQQEQKNSHPTLNNNAPNIIYRTKPSTLVVLDGEPKFDLDKKFNMEKIVNTPSLIVRSKADNLLYFYGGGLWYAAADVNSKWTFVKYLPTEIQKVDDLIHQNTQTNVNDNDYNKATTPSDVIVSTIPTELIQTEGEVSYQNIDATNLLYADNSLDDIFKDINTQQNFILVSGRWYTASSLNGPWTFVPSSQLPADFAKIPEGSQKDGVLANVAGTDAANDAVMNAQVPQTAKIDRKNTTCEVTYDGDPTFSAINGTSLQVAENSNITVLKSGHKYYAVDNGVWFVSHSAFGPWSVSSERPYDVDNIPADNIAYSTRYVYIYDTDPDYVWTGYTPGYTGSYIYGSTVVWGTGFYYSPWYRHHYYPRPYTWGFGCHYNPWTGWGFGYNMWSSIGWGWNDGYYGGGWYGPRHYRPCFNSWGYNGGYYGYGDYYWRGPRVQHNRPAGFGNNYEQPHRNGVRNVQSLNGANSNNLYHHVRGAQTEDVYQQPHRNNAANGDLNGRPFSNPAIHNPVKNIKQVPVATQQAPPSRMDDAPVTNTPPAPHKVRGNYPNTQPAANNNNNSNNGGNNGSNNNGSQQDNHPPKPHFTPAPSPQQTAPQNVPVRPTYAPPKMSPPANHNPAPAPAHMPSGNNAPRNESGSDPKRRRG